MVPAETIGYVKLFTSFARNTYCYATQNSVFIPLFFNTITGNCCFVLAIVNRLRFSTLIRRWSSTIVRSGQVGDLVGYLNLFKYAFVVNRTKKNVFDELSRYNLIKFFEQSPSQNVLFAQLTRRIYNISSMTYMLFRYINIIRCQNYFTSSPIW